MKENVTLCFQRIFPLSCLVFGEYSITFHVELLKSFSKTVKKYTSYNKKRDKQAWFKFSLQFLCIFGTYL